MIESSKPKRRGGSSNHPGVIHADAVYVMDDFKKRTRMENKAIRGLIDRGLVVKPVGNQRFVRGADFINLVYGDAE